MNSDQPVTPSSVEILRNELTRQPASQCRVSSLVIFMGGASATISIMRRAACPANPARPAPGRVAVDIAGGPAYLRPTVNAQVAELVDAQVSGTCGSNVVEV